MAAEESRELSVVDSGKRFIFGSLMIESSVFSDHGIEVIVQHRLIRDMWQLFYLSSGTGITGIYHTRLLAPFKSTFYGQFIMQQIVSILENLLIKFSVSSTQLIFILTLK